MIDRPGPASQPAVPRGEPDVILGTAPAVAGVRSLDRVEGLCPYVIAADGDWRATSPAREHHCSAVDPPSLVALDKQRRLCLVEAHIGCPTFLATTPALVVDEAPDGGQDASETAPGESLHTTAPVVTALDQAAGVEVAFDETAPGEGTPRSAAGRWPMPHTAPVVIERVGFSLASWQPDRSVAQVGLVVLMVLAFVVLAVARLTSDGGSPGLASPTRSSVASVSPSSGGPNASPAPGSSPSQGAPPAASPTAYRVRAGDTLTAIAARFGTTVAVLRKLNDIADPSLLRVGQMLRLP